MPVQQFSSYDVIVDIIPGAIAITMFVLFIPIISVDQAKSSPLLSGAVLLLGGYLVGRLIHSVSSYSLDLTSGIEGSPSATRSSRLIKFIENFVNLNFFTNPNYENPGIDALLSKQNARWPDDINSNIVSEVRSWLISEMDTPLVADPSGLRRYGEGILYGKGTLYTKYQILSTFFRNMRFEFLLIGYSSFIYGMIDYALGAPYSQLSVFSVSFFQYTKYMLVGVLLIIIGYIFLYQQMVFEKRRNRAFFNSLHRIINRE